LASAGVRDRQGCKTWVAQENVKASLSSSSSDHPSSSKSQSRASKVDDGIHGKALKIIDEMFRDIGSSLPPVAAHKLPTLVFTNKASRDSVPLSSSDSFISKPRSLEIIKNYTLPLDNIIDNLRPVDVAPVCTAAVYIRNKAVAVDGVGRQFRSGLNESTTNHRTPMIGNKVDDGGGGGVKKNIISFEGIPDLEKMISSTFGEINDMKVTRPKSDHVDPSGMRFVGNSSSSSSSSSFEFTPSPAVDELDLQYYMSVHSLPSMPSIQNAIEETWILPSHHLATDINTTNLVWGSQVYRTSVGNMNLPYSSLAGIDGVPGSQITSGGVLSASAVGGVPLPAFKITTGDKLLDSASAKKEEESRNENSVDESRADSVMAVPPYCSTKEILAKR
jgi:hypothetical protein